MKSLVGLASFYTQISGNPRDMKQLEQYHRDMLCCYVMRPVMSPMLMRGVALIEEFPLGGSFKLQFHNDDFHAV